MGSIHAGFAGHEDFGGHEGFDSGGHVSVEHKYDSGPVTIEQTKPYHYDVVKKVGVPDPHPVEVPVPQVIKVGVPQPYPVHVAVPQPVAVPIYKLVPQEIEKKCQYTLTSWYQFISKSRIKLRWKNIIQFTLTSLTPFMYPSTNMSMFKDLRKVTVDLIIIIMSMSITKNHPQVTVCTYYLVVMFFVIFLLLIL